MYSVFIVDDDKRIISALTELIESLSKTKVLGNADNEDAAIEWLIENRLHWDMAIVDLTLRSGSGLRVLSACRVRRSNQKIAVLSGHLDSAMRRRCETLGADAVFEKDKNIELLLAYCSSNSETKF